ncbi:restriction endonuclease subunit S [Phocaeicola plebeius]|jgi:type I restriction enzyme S subunit|uniref:restriction endonuclease subunit S n=1 Tax=Phocaeicola plebeius TaxID=310297 RepID=UPI001958AA12|nr:restriction endonuclease subunit S [Phocaeicola plebeius]MBM6843767.1 restriction endonuclease subunit S [Phocaeicola plebeius]
MSKENYRRLGDYIREVDVRNRDLEVKELVGLTINKAFIPSVANTIGTDLSNYKVIRKEQFACSLMQVSRDGKMPVAMFEGECAIMSPAYPMFEVVDNNILLPQYLMMWFSRNEFDREASFYAVGGVRGSLTWQDFCDMTLPIPPIEQQRKIVAEYETITKRIRINEQMIIRLEETAQTLYCKMFVDGIDKENLPEGWRIGTLGEIAEIKAGGDKPKSFSNFYTTQCQIPVIANGIENMGIIGYTEYSAINKPAITVSARGTIGVCFIRTKPYYPIVRLISVIPQNRNSLHNLWFQLSYKQFEGDGSVQNQLTIPVLERENIIIPENKILEEFEKRISVIGRVIEVKSVQNTKLNELQSLLLAKMGQIFD